MSVNGAQLTATISATDDNSVIVVVGKVIEAVASTFQDVARAVGIDSRTISSIGGLSDPVGSTRGCLAVKAL